MALSKTFLGSFGEDTSVNNIPVTVNSTGYTHVVVFVKHEGAVTTITATDNKSSGSYNQLTKVDHANGDLSARMLWVKIGSPGSSHTITVSFGAARPYRRIEVWGVNSGTGDIAVDVSAQNSGTSTAADAGTLTTTTATASFMGTTPYTFCTYTPSSGWTEDLDSTIHGQSRTDASGTLDPACTISLSTAWIACSASFKETSSGTSVTPATLALTLALFAPSIILGTVLTPATATLTTSAFAPSPIIGTPVTPSTLALTTSTFAPSLVFGTVVTPSTAPLSLSTFAPTVAVSDNKSVTPSTASLTTSTFAPSVNVGSVVTPATAELVTTTFEPTVTASANQIITPDPVALALTTYAPDVQTTADIEPTIIIIGGDDAPGATYPRKKKRKDDHEFFREIEATIHRLLNPQASELGEGSVLSDVSTAQTDISRRVDELVVLAQGQHDLLQRVAALRAELSSITAKQEREREIEQDEEDALIWMF